MELEPTDDKLELKRIQQKVSEYIKQVGITKGKRDKLEILDSLFTYLAGPGAPLLESRVCQYSNTETGNLIIDNHPEAVNVLFLGGDSGHGFKYGPAIGDYVSKLLVGEANLRELFKL